jgi:dTDP-4-dehydrorhamnose 3,5-epimerase
MIKEYALKGVATRLLDILPDERGFFLETMRKDWSDFIDEEILQSNMSFSYPGVVRAWHKHQRGQIDYFLVAQGAMKICAYDDIEKRIVEIVASQNKLMLVKVPGFYWHGTKTISDIPALLVYFTTRLYDYTNPDEERRPWNDPLIIPSEINGNIKDPRIGKPWDWSYLSYK